VTSEWIGIDGWAPSTTLIQAGVTELYDPTTNLVTTGAWWEILPDDPTNVLINWNQVSVHPGDSVSVAISQMSGSLWSIGVVDNTTGQSFATQQLYSGAGATAEWIVEAPTTAATGTTDTLGDFTPPISFSNARLTGAQTTTDAVTMVQGGVSVAVPSALVSGAFTVTYAGSPTPAPSPTPTPTPTLKTSTITLGQQFSLTLTGGSPFLQAQWQVSSNGVTWAPLITVTLDASGDSSYTFAPTQTAFYRTYYPTLTQYGSWLFEVIVTGASPSPTATPSVQVSTITLGQQSTLTVTGGAPYSQVQWQISPDDATWTLLTTVMLDASGNATYTIAPTQTAFYRIYVPSSGQYGSRVTEVIVTQPLTPTPSPTPSPAPSVPTIFTVTAGEPVTLTQPGPPNTALTLQTSPDDLTWTSLAQLTTDAGGNATYTFTPAATAYYRSLFADGSTPAGIGVVLPAVSGALALAGPKVITWGTTARFGIAFVPNGGRQIEILASRDTISWSTIATVTTDGTGVASFTYRPATNLYYRAVFTGAPDLAAHSSAAVRTVVREIALPRLVDGGRLMTVSRGTSVTFATVVRPDRTDLPAPVATFRVYRWSGSAWALYRSVVTTADGSGVASLRWTFGSSGNWFVTSMADPTPYNANSVWAAPLRFDVR
jgi:hypothetical protein